MSSLSFWRGWRLPLLLCGFVILCGAPSLSWCQDSGTSFERKLDQASKPLLTEPEPVSTQARMLLVVFQDELKAIKMLSDDSSAKAEKALADKQAVIDVQSDGLKEAFGTEVKVGIFAFLAGVTVIAVADRFKRH